MIKLLKKEIKLVASPLSFLFLAFAGMTLIPGYPILMGAFFICLGIYQSFQGIRDNHDILYSILLPIAKKDVVKAKYAFCILIEMAGFLLMLLLTLVRMTVLADAVVYRTNALLTANFVYLGFVLLIFSMFQALFLNGFFKTAYFFGKPYIVFMIAALLIIGIAEVLPHFPSFSWMDSFGMDHIVEQLAFFGVCVIVFLLITWLSYQSSKKRFQNVDL